MSLHDPLIRIRHMLDHAIEAVEMLGQTTLDQLREDRKLQLALVQLIEIIAEAASRVPNEVRSQYPSVPWQLAADMRNQLIHGYDVVEYEVVYDTINDDLPILIKQLQSIL